MQICPQHLSSNQGSRRKTSVRNFRLSVCPAMPHSASAGETNVARARAQRGACPGASGAGVVQGMNLKNNCQGSCKTRGMKNYFPQLDKCVIWWADFWRTSLQTRDSQADGRCP